MKKSLISMRILMIIDGLSSGGAEKVVLTLSKGLLKIGHKVTLFSLRKKCSYTVPDEIDFQIIQDNCKKFWRKINEISRRSKLLDNAIDKAELDGKFDIIFSHLHKTDRIVKHSRSLEKNKVWFCIHSILSFSYLHHKHGFFRWFKQKKIQNVYKNRNIVAVSSAVMIDILKTMLIPLKHVIVIHNPFDIDMIQSQMLESFEMCGKEYLIHIGRFHDHKRHDRLLRAYALSKIDVPLVMIGDGLDIKIASLKSLAKKLKIIDKVIFRSFVSNPYPWIRGARLLVLSSDCEGFGNVLIEAIICKTPIVSTRCPGGPVEILTGSLARGLSDLNENSLAKTLVDIYHNPPIVDNTKILSSYNVYNICRQYSSLAKLS